MKRRISMIIGITMQMSMFAGMTAQAEEAQLAAVTSVQEMQIGEYFTLGKYDEEPIVWRYMDEDENGKLMVSDRILCEKPFGDMGGVENRVNEYNNFWQESFIRTWLNADVDEGEVDWSPYVYTYAGNYMELQEKGFLHESNFSALDKKVMKPVTQWTMLPEDRLDLSENGINTAYTAIKKTIPGSPRDGGGMIFFTIEELPEAYVGAAYQVTDTVFLLDEMQIYHIWENFGDVKALMCDGYTRKEKKLGEPWLTTGGYYSYYLRTPTNTTNSVISWEDKYLYGRAGISNNGIRPAFYLDEEQAMILSGSGTEEDPYVMSGKGIRVSLNGKDLQFDKPGTIKDGIVLVPLRSIFEELGATINWDEASQTVTAVKDKDKIQMQIGSSILSKNGTETDLGYPAVLEGERTMVPLNAIEVGFGATVDWNGDTLQVTITN